MPLVVVTRMSVGRPRHVLPFLWASGRAAVQTWRSPGYVTGALRAGVGREFWTVTVWEDGRAMSAYRDSGVHGRVMPSLARWAREGAFVAWPTAGRSLPGWEEIHRRVAAEGRFTDLERPAPGHRDRTIGPLRPAVVVPLGRRRRG